MSLKLHPLKVKKITKLTSEAVAINFEIPAELYETFKYVQGQFLSIQVNVDGQKVRREYSLCSSPYSDSEHTIASKIIGNGIVSNYFYHRLKEGDVLEVYPPQGKFYTQLKPENQKHYFLIGGGSGITPLFSILKSVLHVEPQSKIVLYYGNATEESIIFRKELDDLAANYPDRLKIFYTLSDVPENWTGMKGMINNDDLLNLLKGIPSDKQPETEFFICGPVEMMDLSKKVLLSAGIPSEKIHIEYFTAPVHHEEYIPEGEENDEVKEREVEIILDGNNYKITVPPDTAILDAAMNADLDPPFSCKSGICTTCRAKLYSGKVKMDEREGLSDSEIEEGYILTCQSHPLTDNVKLEYM